jgi:hypothetical protein
MLSLQYDILLPGFIAKLSIISRYISWLMIVKAKFKVIVADKSIYIAYICFLSKNLILLQKGMTSISFFYTIKIKFL